ncbi:winged helix-turn-helix transcriptional regulator [Spirillospora sp. NPDC050679]
MNGDAYHADCPGRAVLDHVTSRWAVLALGAMSDGPLRFFELRNRIEGISDKMLSQTLRTLQRDGLVERTVVPATPPEVSYALSPLGSALAEPLLVLLDSIRTNTADIVLAQRRYDEASGRS